MSYVAYGPGDEGKRADRSQVIDRIGVMVCGVVVIVEVRVVRCRWLTVRCWGAVLLWVGQVQYPAFVPPPL